ncbi:ion channel [Achlya hypogyna]|uniref:Ion channel n=1 Tax=Achlya hypogyna TaxID=1202772 RepID=A0A1V9YQR3_ACHHY|nr:ion channel [Achlya hypogyna]
MGRPLPPIHRSGKSKGRVPDDDDEDALEPGDLFGGDVVARTMDVLHRNNPFRPKRRALRRSVATIFDVMRHLVRPQEAPAGTSLNSSSDLLASAPRRTLKRPRSDYGDWTWKQHLVYKFDRWIFTQRGQMTSLVIFGLALNFLCAPWVMLADPTLDYWAAVWESWLYVSDRANQQYAIATVQRVLGVTLTLGGFVFLDVVIGVIVDDIRGKLNGLKTGKSQVVETNHTLVLGWSSRSIAFIKELCRADRNGVIVFFTDGHVDSIQYEFTANVTAADLGNTKVVFRSGNALVPAELQRVAVHTARSVSILATHEEADKSDAMVLRILLCLRSIPGWDGHIVADVGDIDNDPLLKLVGGPKFHSVVSQDIVGRLLVLCGRCPGLAKVYETLLGYSGMSLFCEPAPSAAWGMEFVMLHKHLPQAVAIGVQDATGVVVLNPPLLHRISPGDNLIVLAHASGSYAVEAKAVDVPPLRVPSRDRRGSTVLVKQTILICGWRRDIRDMLVKMDELCPFGSEVHLLNEVDADVRSEALFEAGLDTTRLHNISLVHLVGNPAVRRHLRAISLAQYDYFMVVTDMAREADILASDSHVLATVLLLRTEECCQGNSKKPCIAEILDPRTHKTICNNVSIRDSADFVHSTALVTCVLVMIAHNASLEPVLTELLGCHGPSFDIVPGSRYCFPREFLSFYQIAERAQQFHEVVCGYQSLGQHQTVLNPPDKHLPKSWERTNLIVLRDTQWSHFRKHVDTVVMACDAFYQALRRRRRRMFLVDNGLKRGPKRASTLYPISRQPSNLHQLVEDADLASELFSISGTLGDSATTGVDSASWEGSSRRNSTSSDDDWSSTVDDAGSCSAFNFCAYRQAIKARETRELKEFNGSRYNRRRSAAKMSILDLVATDTVLQECRRERRSTVGNVEIDLISHNPLTVMKAQREYRKTSLVHVPATANLLGLLEAEREAPHHRDGSHTKLQHHPHSSNHSLLRTLPLDIQHALDLLDVLAPAKATSLPPTTGGATLALDR